ncbi:anti-sigma factor family protein [Ferdinandcohnia quinoae]|uniref:Anti-sigma-W factor RsiW n=1 Tax=Fredinandcohnia quinoae TaxID=2918902 RepID=A0AAW5E9S2_9BACI|nr:anti-sigma factor [Fredinandcohnia sp. SECRCQ15]MCH1627965.1 anti-sigma factor [Fredinandcohnia sp. SECRCQ15]
MNCSEDIELLMHRYLDEDISVDEEKLLREHLHECESCNQHFHELKKTIALVQSTSHISAPSDFTMKVMANLPKEKRTVGFRRWFRSHPLLTAASLFLLLMGGSVFSLWNENEEFSVSNQSNLIIENNTVTVPEGEVVKGDVVVRNGKLIIEGQVEGNVTVINGEKYMASAGQVTGDIKEVNQMFEWLWYNIKKVSKDAVHIFDKEELQMQ